MARNRSEAEPTIEGVSDALMHVLRMDAMGVKTPGDALYEALCDEDKDFYAKMPAEDINLWAPKFKAWHKAKLAQEEDKTCHATKVNG